MWHLLVVWLFCIFSLPQVYVTLCRKTDIFKIRLVLLTKSHGPNLALDENKSKIDKHVL